MRVFVRDKNRLNGLGKFNIEVSEGDFEDIHSLEAALQGVDRLMLIGRDNPNQVKQHSNVIQVAKKWVLDA